MTGGKLLRPFAEGKEGEGIELSAIPRLGIGANRAGGAMVAEGTVGAFKSALFERPGSPIGFESFGSGVEEVVAGGRVGAKESAIFGGAFPL